MQIVIAIVVVIALISAIYVLGGSKGTWGKTDWYFHPKDKKLRKAENITISIGTIVWWVIILAVIFATISALFK